jgi:argininosuccinate synthase
MDSAAKNLDSLVSGTVTLRLGNDQEAVIARKEPNGEILYSDKYLLAIAYMVEAALRAVPKEMK